MNGNLPEPLAITVNVVMAVLVVAMLLTFMRLVRGPSVLDRVVALDLMATQSVGIIAVYGITMREPVYLRVAIVLALITFLGTVAFAYYLQKRGA